MRGVVKSGQVAEVLLETTTAVQLSLPRAVTRLLTEQTFVGVVKLAVKFAVAPGARLATFSTTVLGAG